MAPSGPPRPDGSLDDGQRLRPVARHNEVAKIFYGDFLPEAEHLLPGVTDSIRASAGHAWLKGLTPETRQQMQQYYEKFWSMTTAPPAPPMTGPPAAPEQPADVMTTPSQPPKQQPPEKPPLKPQ